ncbi:MAG: phosphatidate cytidylyltransferase, partial [Elusimicrobia bacterium]|nr:phosphatidate cytidylyltransferase [Elusimicrobiota bacterium]
LFLTFGDGFAALAGERFGKHKIFNSSNKTVEGTAANLTACLITGFMFWFLADAGMKPNIVQIIFGSVAATVVEALPIPRDNLFIPIISGFVMKLLK